MCLENVNFEGRRSSYNRFIAMWIVIIDILSFYTLVSADGLCT